MGWPGLYYLLDNIDQLGSVWYVQILAIQKSTEYVGEKLNYLHDKHISSSSLHIYAQVEHYFGDYNLPKDKWMLEKMEECDDGKRTTM